MEWPTILLQPHELDNVRLVTGNSNRKLAEAVASALGIQLMDIVVTAFGNTETRIKPSGDENSTFRGKDIFILQTGAFTEKLSVNDYIMELNLLMDACHRGGCKSMTLIVPFYPYARQDKKDSSRAPISAAVVANNLAKAGLNRIVCFDLHNPCIQGYFAESCDNLFVTKLQRRWLMQNIFHATERGQGEYVEKFVFISPDEGAMKKTRIIANALGIPFLTMSKTRDYSQENVVERIVLLCDADQLESTTKPADLLRGKTAIIVDDMIDTAGTVIQAVKKLMNYGALACGVLATHGVLSGPALDRITGCDDLHFVAVCDTLPQHHNQESCSKIQVISVAEMLAEVVRRITVDHSLSSLF